MKKLIVFLSLILILTACSENINSPKKEINKYLSKYQQLDDDVIKDLDTTIVKNGVDESNYKVVRDAFKRQYVDMNYKVISEKIKNNIATVKVAINVYDYSSSRKKSIDYIEKNQKKFMTNNEIDIVKTNDYVYKNYIKETKRKKYYTKIKLKKVKNKWIVSKFSNDNIKKIHGTY